MGNIIQCLRGRSLKECGLSCEKCVVCNQGGSCTFNEGFVVYPERFVLNPLSADVVGGRPASKRHTF